ncbi:MAG: ABC transporter ATP-binding protein [Chloroflexi bacterium]|nr:ABC transporter ATP-binding protein [Chloroflexota bacterium]
MSTDYVISIEGLAKSYGRVQALRGVDLHVRRGELFGFLGPNGAGKTTTIRCLLDLIRPERGTMRVLGFDPRTQSVEVRARVGYLPGELNLEGNLRVRDTLRYYGSLRRHKLDWSWVEELARRLELDLNVAVKNLSKGNKQKVGVVQALMARPELLLLDEPTSGLDPLMQQEVYRLLREAQAAGATVFFSSHIISEVEAIAQSVAMIRGGVIAEETEPARLLDMAVHRVRVRLAHAADWQPLLQVAGVTLVGTPNHACATFSVEGEMDAFIKTLAAYAVQDIEVEHPTLEEVFLSHYATGEGR